MVMYEDIVGITGRKDNIIFKLKLEAYNEENPDDKLSYEEYLEQIIFYYEYLFKYYELIQKPKTKHLKEQIDEISNKLMEMEDKYYFGFYITRKEKQIS